MNTKVLNWQIDMVRPASLFIDIDDMSAVIKCSQESNVDEKIAWSKVIKYQK